VLLNSTAEYETSSVPDWVLVGSAVFFLRSLRLMILIIVFVLMVVITNSRGRFSHSASRCLMNASLNERAFCEGEKETHLKTAKLEVRSLFACASAIYSLPFACRLD